MNTNFIYSSLSLCTIDRANLQRVQQRDSEVLINENMNENTDELLYKLAETEFLKLTDKERENASEAVIIYNRLVKAGLMEWMPPAIFLKDKIFNYFIQ